MRFLEKWFGKRRFENPRFKKIRSIRYEGQGGQKIQAASVEVLIDAAANDQDPRIRREAAAGLGFSHHKTQRVLNALASALQDDDAEVREDVVWAFANLIDNEPNPGKLPDIGQVGLTRALSDHSPKVVSAATWILLQYCTLPPPDALFENLLGSFMEAQQNVSGKLVELRHRMDDDGQFSAQFALAVPAIAHALNHTAGLGDRQRIAEMLTKLGPAARAAASDVAPLVISGADCIVRNYIAEFLAQLGPDAKPAIPYLAQAIINPPNRSEYETGDFYLAERAASALKNIGKPAVPALVEAYKRSKHYASYAENALKTLGYTIKKKG